MANDSKNFIQLNSKLMHMSRGSYSTLTFFPSGILGLWKFVRALQSNWLLQIVNRLQTQMVGNFNLGFMTSVRMPTRNCCILMDFTIWSGTFAARAFYIKSGA